MKKTWTSLDVVELNIAATANESTELLQADEYTPGVGFKRGTRTGSGPVYEIRYKPENK